MGCGFGIKGKSRDVLQSRKGGPTAIGGSGTPFVAVFRRFRVWPPRRRGPRRPVPLPAVPPRARPWSMISMVPDPQTPHRQTETVHDRRSTGQTWLRRLRVNVNSPHSGARRVVHDVSFSRASHHSSGEGARQARVRTPTEYRCMSPHSEAIEARSRPLPLGSALLLSSLLSQA